MDKILIVEDDEMIRCGIEDALQLRNWETDSACNFYDAKEKIHKNHYMLYILDMRLPDGNGITLCREIRKFTNNPVLFLSAYDTEGYIVEGFEAGGDDYVTKPFRTFELLARIQSLLRRAKINSDKKIVTGIKSKNFFLDMQKECIFEEKHVLDLTLTEYRILKCLIKNAPQLMSRNQLLQIIWDCHEEYVDDNTLSVYMSRIRKKIMQHSADAIIETKRGIGYRWIPATEEVYE